jgi:two-component system, chemotaxis family, sensor kinase CheA
MGNFSDEAIIQEFVIESRDHLASIEPDLLVMEKVGNQAGPDLINRVFRAIHSIKGASGFFGLDALKHLSHVMESVLMMIRDGQLEPTGRVMDPLLVGVDRLRLMLEDVHQSHTIEHKDIIEKLERVMSDKGKADFQEVVEIQASVANSGASDNARAPFSPVFEPDRLALENVQKQGQFLYSLRIHMDVDLSAKGRNPLDLFEQLHTIGSVLDTVLDTSGIQGLSSCLDDSLPVLFLFGSVLEADLVALTIDIPEAQIQRIAPESFQATLSQVSRSESSIEEPAPVFKASQAPEEASEPMPSSFKEESKFNSESNEATPVQDKARKTVTPEVTETVRVKVDLLNRLMDLAGEMVLSRNQLIRIYERDLSQVNGLSTIIQNVDLITTDLQEHIMQTRMQSISGVFGKFPRIVRDMSQQLGKQIQLETVGEEVELDKSILESLSDPLTHLIRNCCDHALETPDERKEKGKGAVGTITLKAFQESGHINIMIQDDGRGIDHDRIAKKAIANGMLSENELKRMTPQEVVNLIFLPGLSTAEKVSDISGRGVGMDVVRTNIEKLGGHISVDTTLGKGTKILLRLPLTLAIIPSLVVGVYEQKFAIPQVNLVELVCIRSYEVSTRIEKVGSVPVLRLRGKLLPLIRLADILGFDKNYVDEETGDTKPDARLELGERRQNHSEQLLLNDKRENLEDRRKNSQKDYNLLVLKVGASQYGLIVDDIYDMEEIVVKPLSGLLKNCRCFSGATIMGDGRVAMILDAAGIAAFSGLSFADIENEEKRRKMETHANAVHTEKKSLITFNNAEKEVFAIPLESVLRLERFSTDIVEKVGRKEFITYRGRSLPLIRLEEQIPVGATPSGLKEAFLIIPKAGDGSAGIVTSRILDTIETDVQVEKSYINHPGVSGVVIINDHHTLLIEPEGLLASAGVS